MVQVDRSVPAISAQGMGLTRIQRGPVRPRYGERIEAIAGLVIRIALGHVTERGDAGMNANFDASTTPNADYWIRTDTFVALCAQYGLWALLNPYPPNNGDHRKAGATACRTFGQFVGKRYKKFPTVGWQFTNSAQKTPLWRP